MKRKVYKTFLEKREDQTIGMIAFPVINVVLAFIISSLSPSAQREVPVLLTPWIVNGGFISFALVFRSQIGIGYMASFVIIIIMAMLLGVIFLAACFGAAMVAAPFAFVISGLGVAIGTIAFPVFFFGGAYYTGRLVAREYRKKWWPSPSDEYKEKWWPLPGDDAEETAVYNDNNGLEK